MDDSHDLEEVHIETIARKPRWDGKLESPSFKRWDFLAITAESTPSVGLATDDEASRSQESLIARIPLPRIDLLQTSPVGNI